MTSADLTLETARQVLAAQPFSALVGARLTAFGEAAATLEIDVRDELRQQYGLLHGGVLGYAADNVLTFAAGSVLGPSVVTAGFAIEYLRPVREGTLRADAWVSHANSRRAVCQAELHADSAGETTLCAIAHGTILTTQRA